MLSREYGFTPEQILKMTEIQVGFYLSFIQLPPGYPVEYMEVPGGKEFMKQIAAMYKKSGREMPNVIL